MRGKVIRFSIGFGKVLFKKKDKQGTEFVFSLIPLGGYVQMWNGETDINAPAQQALNTKSVLQRAFIIIAGPAANFIFAILAYWVVFIAGIPTVKPVIGKFYQTLSPPKQEFLPNWKLQKSVINLSKIGKVHL